LAAIQIYNAKPLAQASAARTMRALAVVRPEEAICTVEDSTQRKETPARRAPTAPTGGDSNFGPPPSLFDHGAVDAADLAPTAIQTAGRIGERRFGGGFLIDLDPPTGLFAGP